MNSRKKILIGVGVGVALFLILGVFKTVQIYFAIKEGKARQQPPQAVTSFIAEEEIWDTQYKAVGIIEALHGAVLSVEEGGRVSKINFESGAEVKDQDLLLELDASVEIAQLAGLRAQLGLAETSAKRQRALRERNANSQSDLDSAEASLRSLSADVKRLEAIIERKKIIAPFSGKLGIRRVALGQNLAAGTQVVEISKGDNLLVNFSLPQTAIKDLKTGLTVEVSSENFKDQKFSAKLTAIGSILDPVSRNINIQAELADHTGLLKPGMFVEVKVLVPSNKRIITIPATSIAYAPYGNNVYIIDKAVVADGPRPVHAQNVEIGERRGDKIEIISGLTVGTEIVSSGTFKLYPGVNVTIDNSLAPDNLINPNPKNT